MEITLKQRVSMDIDDVAGFLTVTGIVSQKVDSITGSAHEPPTYTQLETYQVEIELIEEDHAEGSEVVEISNMSTSDLDKIKAKLIEEAEKHLDDFEEEDEFDMGEPDYEESDEFLAFDDNMDDDDDDFDDED